MRILNFVYIINNININEEVLETRNIYTTIERSF